jgi:hypothetical protein
MSAQGALEGDDARYYAIFSVGATGSSLSASCGEGFTKYWNKHCDSSLQVLKNA